MAILGESFKDYVRKQINVRQDKLSLRDRDNDILKYITSKTSFLRLTSGVDVSSKVAQNLGVIGLEGNLLAKQYVLESAFFRPTSETRPDFTSGIGYQGYTTSYGFNSDPNYGLVPPPGLTIATINTLNRGTIREATINLVCHNLYQFKIINALFLKLKYSLLLEWGHTLYFNNGTDTNPNASLVTPIEAGVVNLSDEFLKGMSSDEILNKIEKKRIESSGNYDAFFGVVKNFNWELQENGSYNITINAISQGDVIESLKVNSNLAPETITVESINGVDETMYKKSTLHYILGWIIRKLKDSGTLDGFKTSPESNALNTDTLSTITKLTPGYKESDDTGEIGTSTSSLTYREGITILFPELGKVYDQNGNASSTLPQYYIKLGTLLRIIEAFLLYYDTSKNENGSSPSIFYINHSFDDNVNECITTPRHISADPLTCIIPFDFANASEASTGASVTYFYTQTTSTKVFFPNYRITSTNSDGSSTAVASVAEYVGSNPQGDTQTLDNNVVDDNVIKQLNKEIISSITDTSGNPLSEYGFYVGREVSSFRSYLNALKDQGPLVLPQQEIRVSYTVVTRKEEAVISNAAQAGVLEYVDDSFRTSNKNIGNTMHIYVNINKIIEILDNNIDSNGDVTIYNFLTQLLGEISRAMGAINKFDLDYDETTNRFSVIDAAVFPLKYRDLEKARTAKFNINLLKDSNNGGGSFVTNFGLKSDVFGQISNAIAVGAQGNGNNLGSNSTPISNFNEGLTDRIVKDKKNPNITTNSTGSWVDQNPQTFNKYEQFKYLLAQGTVKAYDIDLYKNTLVDLFNYDLGYYTENAVIPGTGFIPLNLQLTMDGLSGMRQYQTFDIDETLLPDEYSDKLKFITTTITHKIDTKGWETTINSLGVPKTKKDPQPVDQNIPEVTIKKDNKETVDISKGANGPDTDDNDYTSSSDKKTTLSPSTKLSKYVTLQMAAYNSAIAKAKGIDNTPTEEAIENLKTVCTLIYDKLYDAFNGQITLNSAYRSPELNKAVGGSKTSGHLYGRALDIEGTGGVKNKEIYNYIKANIPEFDQMIWEYGTKEEPSWVHISYDSKRNRKSIFSIGI